MHLHICPNQSPHWSHLELRWSFSVTEQIKTTLDHTQNTLSSRLDEFRLFKGAAGGIYRRLVSIQF